MEDRADLYEVIILNFSVLGFISILVPPNFEFKSWIVFRIQKDL
jgi:hypothetical protein